jgi:hypothetical protein
VEEETGQMPHRVIVAVSPKSASLGTRQDL